MTDDHDRPNGTPTIPIRRWQGIRRDYTQDDVRTLRGSVRVDYTLAEMGARRLWGLLQSEDAVQALAVASEAQSLAQVRAGVPALWLDAGGSDADEWAVPALVRRVNRALTRADEIECAAGRRGRCWHAPVVADAGIDAVEPFQAFERMKALIEAGAAGVVFADGDMPSERFVRTLNAARLAADVLGVPTLLVARIVEADLDRAIERARNCAPYADLVWWEASTAELEPARRFAEAVHVGFPGKILACSGSLPPVERREETASADERARLGFRFRLAPGTGVRARDAAIAAPASRETVADYSDAVRRILSGDASLTAPPPHSVGGAQA